MSENSSNKLEEIKDWIFTFGLDNPLFSGMYVVIPGTFNSAREKMFEVFGKKWAFQYENSEKAGVERFSLRKISTILDS